MTDESTSETVTLTHSQFERLELELARCKLAIMPLMNAAGIQLNLVENPPPMSQEEVENWILLKGQTEERWFEIRILDPEVGNDPTAVALMTVLSDMINQGIHNMPFLESQAKDQRDGKPDLQVIDTGGRDVKGG